MLTFTSAQLAAWVGTFLWPFFRILALLSSAPVFSAPQVSIRLRLGLAIVIAIVIAPTLPAVPPVEPLSPAGFVLIAQQVLIGLAMGFTMRLIFAAFEFAGNFIGLQMGLGFATLMDPQNGAQSPVMGSFLTLITTLAFLATNGHLMMIAALGESFRYFPILPGQGIDTHAWRLIVAWGGSIFTIGTILALPIIAVILVVNIALAVLSKVSPQLNIFVIGFPLLLGLGLWGLSLLLPYMMPIATHFMEEGSAMLMRLLGTLAIKA